MRPDWCPLANHPCMASCDVPCGRQPSQLQQALDFLRGLHPEITRDEPLQVARQIFDHVMAERQAAAEELKNAHRNIEGRDEYIRKLTAQGPRNG